MNTDKQKEFMEAYNACHEPFVRYCSALAFGKMDSQDLVQDVLLSAFKNFENIRNKDQMLHYLVRSAKNRAISIWRKEKFQTDLLEQHENRLVAKGACPGVLLDVQYLYKQLATLPIAQADAIMLYEVSGFKMREIADILGKKESAVKTLISRGRVKLKKKLTDTPSGKQGMELMKSLQTLLF